MDFSSSSSSSPSLSRSTEETIEEIMKTHRTLPARPRTEEVEAALTVVENAAREEISRLEALSSTKNNGSSSMAVEFFTILQEMQKSIVCFECKEKKRDALKLLDLENVHVLFDDLIMRASSCVSNSNRNSQDQVIKNRIDRSDSGTKAHNALAHNASSSKNSGSVSSSGLFDKGVNEKKKGKELTLVARDDSYLLNNKVMSTFKFNTDNYAIGHKLSSKPSIVDNSSMIHASISGNINYIASKTVH